MPPFDSKPSRFSPQPHWKTATRMPYAAPTERRLSRIAFSATTIERNETSMIRKANRSTKPKTSGADVFIFVFPVLVQGGRAADGVLDAVDLAERAREHVLAERGERGLRLGVGAGAGERDVDRRDGVVAAGLDLDRALQLAGRERLLLEGDDRVLNGWGADVVRLDRDDGRDRCRPGRQRRDCFIGSISGIEMSSRPVVVVFSWRAPGSVSAIRTAPAATAEMTGRRRTRSRTAPQKRLSPFLLRSRPRNGIRPFSTLSPSLPSSAGQHGERAEHRDGDDHHRPDREGHERLVAGEEHAGHRDQHGDAGDEDGAAGGGCGGLEGGVLAASGGTLLTLAAEVEERVVDSDGEADQEDHLGDLLVDRDELARAARSGPSSR